MKNRLVDSGISIYYPPNDLGIWGKFFSARKFQVIYGGARTETEKALFPIIFLRNGTFRKRKELAGALGGV